MTASDQRDGSSRIEREVLEILERAEAAQKPTDALHDAVRRRGASTRATFARARRPTLPSLMSSELIRIVGALLLAFVAGAIADTSHLLAVFMAIVSAILFFSLWFPGRASSSFNAPRWRGQDLRDRGPRSSFNRGRIWPRRPRH
jgi:hypothetical protein